MYAAIKDYSEVLFRKYTAIARHGQRLIINHFRNITLNVYKGEIPSQYAILDERSIAKGLVSELYCS